MSNKPRFAGNWRVQWYWCLHSKLQASKGNSFRSAWSGFYETDRMCKDKQSSRSPYVWRRCTRNRAGCLLFLIVTGSIFCHYMIICVIKYAILKPWIFRDLQLLWKLAWLRQILMQQWVSTQQQQRSSSPWEHLQGRSVIHRRRWDCFHNFLYRGIQVPEYSMPESKHWPLDFSSKLHFLETQSLLCLVRSRYFKLIGSEWMS